jgi:hypothetical protein
MKPWLVAACEAAFKIAWLVREGFLSGRRQFAAVIQPV